MTAAVLVLGWVSASAAAAWLRAAALASTALPIAGSARLLVVPTVQVAVWLAAAVLVVLAQV